MRVFIVVVKVISIALLIWLLAYLGTVYNAPLFNFGNIAILVGDLRDLISYYVYLGLGFIFMGINELFCVLFSLIYRAQGISADARFYRDLGLLLFFNIFGRYFYFPELPKGQLPSLTNVMHLSTTLSVELGPSLYITVIQVVVIAMLVFALRAVLQSDPKYAIRVVVCVNLIIMIPLFVLGVKNLLWRFSIAIPLIDELDALNLLDPSLFLPVSENLWEFLNSTIFKLAFVNFLFLEFSFEVSYLDQVTKPSVEREIRMKNQIIYLKSEAQKAISNLKKMDEKREQDRLNLLKAQQEAGPQYQSEHMKLVEFMSEKGSKQFSYIAEMIEKKKIEREEKALETAMKGTRQLVFFLDKLFVQNPESYHTLTAKTSAPSNVKLVTSTVMNMAFRFGVILLLTFFSSHPRWFIETIFHAPEAITNSVEMLTPEIILTVLLPLLLLFPIISQIIRATKHQKLQELLRIEEIRRAGLTEDELVEVKARNEAEKIEETKFATDAEAAAQPAMPNIPEA